MKIFVPNDLSTEVKNKFIFLDNDFLSELYNNAVVLKEVLTTFQKNPLIIDPLIEFEFLRNVYLPTQFNLKKAFITQDVFSIASLHQSIFTKLNENALLLSQIYAHKNAGINASLVDLHLAARIMFGYQTSLVVTGNKKDFPSCLFEIVSLMNIEKTDSTMKPYYILKFNNKKFQICFEELKKLSTK